MVQIARLSRSAAKANPSQAFDSPADLAAEVMLTRGEKLGALQRWRHDVLHELTAASEGMRTEGSSDRLGRLLRQIDVAMGQLRRAPNPAAALKDQPSAAVRPAGRLSLLRSYIPSTSAIE